MYAPLTQYVLRVMQQPNLPVLFIVDISSVIPVYIIHMRGCHNLELSGAVPVIKWKGRLKEAVPYQLGDVISYALTT